MIEFGLIIISYIQHEVAQKEISHLDKQNDLCSSTRFA
jgi:hypothetical protein